MLIARFWPGASAEEAIDSDAPHWNGAISGNSPHSQPTVNRWMAPFPHTENMISELNIRPACAANRCHTHAVTSISVRVEVEVAD